VFTRVLVANRGEIAVRVIRALHELGVEAVAVYSTADEDAMHVRLADRSVRIGPPSAAESYLNIQAVIAAAMTTGCEAVHPGYGFLAENDEFVRMCEDNDLVFIGPPADVMARMSDKAHAKQEMRAAGVPLVSGTEGATGPEEARAAADQLGYPVLLKAAAGGGGKGMRLVTEPDELHDAFQRAASEAHAAFGDGTLYVEKAITPARHVEIQVLCDNHGTVLTCGERECSIQRRHQKLIEEAPSLQVDAKMRDEIGKTIRRCLEQIGYQNAGTIEFLMDEDGKMYFIEMNTRIQVEHPVTEMVTGIDLVKAQLRIASDEKLSDIVTEPVTIRGHAIECRVNAEHPEKFTPSAGKIDVFNVPGGNGVRVDTAQYAEGLVPPYYDSLIAKLIVHGKDRAEAMARMQRALEMFVVEGIYTTIPLHQKIFADPEFREGRFDTKFMERFFEREKARLTGLPD
jgi:acetyl-CoA carboxylase, biotin carboxylase subunit